jgi:hypothetical protein
LLDIAKAGLAFAFKELADRAADLVFDLGVGIEERSLQVAREVLADSRLATPGKPTRLIDPVTQFGLAQLVATP